MFSHAYCTYNEMKSSNYIKTFAICLLCGNSYNMCHTCTEDQEENKDSQGHWWRVEFPETAVWPSGEKKE